MANQNMLLDPSAISHAEGLGLQARLIVEGYMGGEHFSIADIAAVTVITAMSSELPWAELPQLAAWHERVSCRPAVQAGLAAFDSPPGA